jgi:hypothetical protein
MSLSVHHDASLPRGAFMTRDIQASVRGQLENLAKK